MGIICLREIFVLKRRGCLNVKLTAAGHIGYELCAGKQKNESVAVNVARILAKVHASTV